MIVVAGRSWPPSNSTDTRMTFCFTCFTQTLATSYSWRRPLNFTTETGGELGVTGGGGGVVITGLLTAGTIKRRGCGSRGPRGWSRQRRRLPMRGEPTTSLTSLAGEKFPRSSTWTMTSWRTGRVCRATWHQLEVPRRLRAPGEVTTRSPGLPPPSSHLLLLTPHPQLQWDCSEAGQSTELWFK